RQTLDLIPKHIPQVVLPLGENFATAQILSIYHSIQIVGWMSALHDIDPGRPRIPEFGRKLYHLPARLTQDTVRGSDRQTIVHRKIAALGMNEEHEVSPSIWYKKYSAFRSRLVSVDIRAVVFDYDGTLVETNTRFDPPDKSIAERMVELLKAGIPIGIATGRGNSVRQQLRTVIPTQFQARVLLGYLNASQITRLNTEVEIDEDFADPALERFWERLQCAIKHTPGINIKKYPYQISIRPATATKVAQLWLVVQELANCESEGELKVMTSSHSLDVLPKNVSKVSVVQAICKEFSVDESNVLRIGDNGRWPGNDSELLRSSLGLSVRDVSADPHYCWNLLPTRCNGISGTLYYLDRMQTMDGVVRMQL
ncbi:MAG: HAD family phosphatase, partial [Gammaproteobacteria bacterium]|nr:HAD family phosphatase [Gammaproteobacteria bacterium]